MSRSLALALAAALFIGPTSGAALAQSRPVASARIETPDVPYTKFVLSNGLTLIVHEDRKAPIVAVNIWYHVGSKNEPQGRSGFAHLFEHLMFNGSENADYDWFKTLEKYGATDLNGTTSFDRTNYFQNVPTAALDTVLWMESDRMGHLLGAIDQAKLDEQRGVVQNEKRQGENQPYGRVFNTIIETSYPIDHPYGHTVIGSMEDLNAAKLDDVREWFRTYYGPANATIVIAGDIDAATAKTKVEKFFGDIPPGPPITRQKAWPAKRTENSRAVMYDRVPQARLYRSWNIPERTALDVDHLNLLADVLVSDKTSRLYKRLVYDDQIATDVSAQIIPNEIGGLFLVVATAKPGADLAAVEKAVDEELARLLASGPTADEVTKVRTLFLAGLVKGLERIGGFGGKSDLLAQSQVLEGSPDAWKRSVARVQAASAKDLKEAGVRWLSNGAFTLEVLPFPQYQPIAAGADRKTMPVPGDIAAPRFPAVERATLSNGVKVMLARRSNVPVVNLDLILDAGFAADPVEKLGAGRLAMNMLDEGTRNRDALRISRDLTLLGASLGTGAGLDTASVSMSALKANLDPSLDLFSDVILNPSFPTADFTRLQQQQLATIQQEKQAPQAMGMRVLPMILYGQGHAYAQPASGSGTEETVAALTREDMVRYHQTWFKPNNATLIVTGDITLAELLPKLEARLRGWTCGEVPKKNIPLAPAALKPAIYIVDKPGAIQSVILAGIAAPPKSNPDEIAIETMNAVLGGQFTSRLNMNLREEKGWSYGARTFVRDALGPRMFIAQAPVQSDKTKEALAEMRGELTAILGDRIVTADELASAQSNLTLALPGVWETNQAVAGSLVEQTVYGLPDDYWDTYAGKVEATRIEDLTRAAKTVIRPDALTYVVVGDRAAIEPGLRELNIGEVRVIDADGRPVR